MSLEPRLHRLRQDLQPDKGQQDRIRDRIKARIAEPAYMKVAKEEASTDAQQAVWNSVQNRIDVPVVSGALDRLRSFFDPSESQRQQARTSLFARLAPVEVRSDYRWTKWSAAFVLVIVALRASPVLFLAPRTIAESAVIVVPTRGNTEVSLHDLWQPVDGEVTLNEPVQLRTADGESSILLHDDGTIRLAAGTVVSLHDLSDRPEPALDGPTLTLSEGKIWVQGLIPRQLRGIVISTPYGEITVHDGSVSLSLSDNSLTVRAWSRQAVVTQGKDTVVLVGGEKARFGEGDAGEIARIEEDEYSDAWVKQNLSRDAVHQREIAQMQRERRAAQAGILPNSPLYPVKRVAEKVDVFLTIDPETKVQKQLDLASTRLNEAAGLIAEGSSGAEVPLQEYANALVTVASSSGASSVTQFLLRQEVAENTAELAAARPDDDLYLLKKAVLEASAQPSVDMVDQSDVEGVLIVDTLDVLHEAIAIGDTQRAQETYDALEPHLSSLEEAGALKPDVQKEVLQLLSDAAVKLQETSTGSVALEQDLKPFLPSRILPDIPVEVVHLTDEQIDSMIIRITQRIFVFTQTRSRSNQLVQEIKQLKGHADEGRILRKLYQTLSGDADLIVHIRRAIQDLRQ